MSNSFVQALENHTKEDHAFQQETRLFNEEMAMFKAETEGSLADLHKKIDLILDKFDPDKDDYAFKKMDIMYEVYEGLGFGRKALMVMATVVGSLVVIMGGIFSAIRFIK